MKIKLLILALATLALAIQLPLNAQADKGGEIPLRGVVEGFYGTPWTHEQRLDMLSFMASKDLNAYIYAPKDDEFHRKFWRQPYPADKYAELKELTQKAKQLNIDIVFAVSPGNDIDFSGANKEGDRKAMVAKLKAMYDIGIRHFALFFDDIPEKDAAGQAEFANWINKQFIKKNKGCRPLILVPTEYYLRDMEAEGKAKEYTATLAAKLDKNIMVLYTGAEVCPDGLDKATVRRANEIYGRSLGIWWNYPVSDYLKEKLALGPVDNIDKEITNKDVPAFFINPMEKPELSKIAIATGADYAKNPTGYDENAAWEQAIDEQYGDLGKDMKLFASHSQRMENSWAHIGRADAPELQKLYTALWSLDTGSKTIPKTKVVETLLEKNQERQQALNRLGDQLPAKVLAECEPQLEQLAFMTVAEEYALKILESDGNKDQQEGLFLKLAIAQSQIADKDTTAKISEKALGKFLDDFVHWQAKKCRSSDQQ